MKFTKIILILAAIIYLSGCASGAKMENMVFHGSQKVYSESLKDSLEVSSVTGGQKTNPAWTSEISSNAFSGAVKESLLAQGLLSDNGRYQLKVAMLRVDQPLFGLDLKVTTYVQYILTDISSGSIILNETVTAPYTATFSDAFAAVKRLRLANEGAGKKNIEALLEKLSALKIRENEVSFSK